MQPQRQQATVLSTHPSLLNAIFLFVAGLPFVGVGLAIAVSVFTSDRVATYLPALSGTILAGGFGGLFWRRTYNIFRRWRAFGTTSLRLMPDPVQLGDRLQVRIEAPLSAHEQPPNGFLFRLACHERTTDSDGDYEDELVWKEWTRTRGQPGMEKTTVSTAFDLPVHPLPGVQKSIDEKLNSPYYDTYADKLDDLNWTLDVVAPRDEGPNYKVSFDVSVAVSQDLDERTGRK